MKAISIKGNSPEEIQASLEKKMGQGFNPTLAFVFLSMKQDHVEISDILHKKEIIIFGTTADGEITDHETNKGAISILLLDLNKAYFKVFLNDINPDNPSGSSQEIAARTMKQFSNPAFIIACSEMETNYTKLLQGFADVAGEDVNVYGGVASDDLTTSSPFVFTNNISSKHGIVAVAFDQDKVEIKGKVVCGWNPVGTVRTVTKSHGNKIYEIDNENALDLTLRYAGIKELPQDPIESTILVSRTLAFQFLREKGDPVTLLGLINREDSSFTIQQDIPEGTKFRFALPPDFEVVDKVVESLEEIKTSIPAAEAVLLFSCSGRIDVLGPIVNEEIKSIKNIWDAPLAGFFCNGELARANNGELEIHNLTACCTVLKEK